MTAFPQYTAVSEAGLTPLQIANAYNVPSSDGANVKIGIVSLGGSWSESDFNKSMADLGLSITSANITTILVDRDTHTFFGNEYDAENTLDLYCVAGMAPAANIVIYLGINDGNYYSTVPQSAASLNSTRSFANVINRAVNDNCDIITISWAAREIYSNVYSNYYVGDFLKTPLSNASSQGITVLAATGDYGSQGTVIGANILTANYPATNSNVIAVGGTNLQLTSGNLRLTETVEFNTAGYPPGWGSGGGISNFISLPTWQTGLTYREYFTSNSTVGPLLTLTKRGVPDVSVAMNSYGLWFDNIVQSFGGTSASSPIMAGILARFMSLSGGRRPIPNAIHSVLYANLNAYYDVTSGNNATVSYSNGYAASSNWDPVTGVGVPYGDKVQQLVSSGGTKIKTASDTWNYVANVKVKTNTNTWSNVKAIWTKTVTGWQQTY
jgi:subtilase family serine protease